MYVLLLQIYGHSPIKISQRHITEKNDTGSLQTDLRKWKRDRDDEPCKGSTSPLHSSKKDPVFSTFFLCDGVESDINRYANYKLGSLWYE